MTAPRKSRPAPQTVHDPYAELLPLLMRLDARLMLALRNNVDDAAEDAAPRSLRPHRQDIEAELNRAAGTPRFASSGRRAMVLVGKTTGRWTQIRKAFDLSPFDLDLLLLALAPEIDLRYQRIYSFLQDDAASLHPGVDLALNLLCATPQDRLRRRRHFADDAPLFRHSLLQWSALETAQTTAAPLLARSLRIAPELVEILLGDDDAVATWRALRNRRASALATLTRKLPLVQDWSDLVLPADTAAQLQELCAQVRHRRQVLGKWGFGSKLAFGRGVAALFAGPSGTGKTMAAGVVARELGRELYRIDLSQVVSKYIGETEKNLGRIFDVAAELDAVLFFDEADALFGKRSEVKDAHDRHANIEVGYLLQKMEEYEGLAILATNLRRNLDEAFLRRLNVVIEFPPPDEAQRLRIWQKVFPPQAPLAEDIDLGALAREMRLSGGHLRNIALAAASYAAGEGAAISRRHLLLAAQREHEKLGRTWNGGG